MALPLTESLFVAFISIFLFISFFSNVCVVIAIMKIKTMRTVTNIFLCNLAISDMIIASIVLPQQVHDISHTAGYFERKCHTICHRKYCRFITINAMYDNSLSLAVLYAWIASLPSRHLHTLFIVHVLFSYRRNTFGYRYDSLYSRIKLMGVSFEFILTRRSFSRRRVSI